MSITSCPRCAGQVTLPVGASNRAKVRCPLCHAQYTLADALVNMPPLLEVVDDPSQAATAEWRDTPPAALEEPPSVESSLVDELDLDETPTASTVSGADLTAVGQSEELSFEAAEADEELSAQDEDTEIEDLSFSTFESADAPGTAETAPAAQADDDNVLDFGEPLPAEARGDAESSGDEEMTLDFGAEELSEESAEAETLQFGAPLAGAAADDEVAFDLDQPETVGDTDATIAFSDAPSIRADDDVEFDLEAVDEAPPRRDPELGEFGDFQVDASGEGEDIPLDVPDESAPAAVAEEPAGKKGKKKKEKKIKAAGERPKRSWVGAALTAVVALPIALYVALWAGFDPIGLAGYLPGFMVPAGMTRKVAQRPFTPPPSAPGASNAWAGAGDAAEPPADAAQPSDAETPSGEHTAARPESQPDAAAPAEAAPAPEATTPSADAPPEGAAPAPENPPAEMPAETPADDPLATPADARPELPAAPGDKPPAPTDDSNPFDAPNGDAPAKDPMPADDPLAPADPKPADDPFAPAADEKPAADDPLAPAADEKPAGDDPFAPSKDAASATPGTEPLPVPEEPATPAEPLGPRNVLPATPAELQTATQATMAAAQQMVAAQGSGDEAQLRKARANFYVSLFGMANALTLVQLGPAGSQLEPQLRAMEPMLRQQLAADPKQFELLKVFGARWFAFPKRTTSGVVLAGTVESVEQVGKLYHAKVRPGAATDPTVTIVSTRDPQCAAGDEVLTFGSIVEQPSEQLSGYQGTEPAVVWSGMTIKMSPAGN
jgi:hypothetical protein